MLYQEFIEGTGCKDNAHNYKVYRDLEIMYMNSDISKAEIYEYGKKLVDNSKSAEQIALEEEINEQISVIKEDIESDKRWMRYYKAQKEANKSVGDKFWEGEGRRMERYYMEEIRMKRNKISELKWVLSA